MNRTTRAIFYGADLPIPPDEAFAFISDPASSRARARHDARHPQRVL